METEIRVLKFLLDSGSGAEHSIRAVSSGIKADYNIVHRACSALLGKGLIEKRRAGSSYLVRLSGKFSGQVFEAERQRADSLRSSKDIRAMEESLKDGAGTANFVMLVFGSWAKGKQGKNSDIDIMFIVPDGCAGAEKKIDESVSLLPLPIHHMVFTESQFRKMIKSREKTVVSEAAENRIILYGTEQYYELIK
jgi:hypothetical protein